MNVSDAIIQSLGRPGEHHWDDEVTPVAILWLGGFFVEEKRHCFLPDLDMGRLGQETASPCGYSLT